ncbi:MAG TPA: acyl-CoA dehydrogenase family protein [Burkholderiales bacterium]|nr:acyl-CoA dehydrogenase family protein [Burkholderiales bacterium]
MNAPTHRVFNQPPALEDYNPWNANPTLGETVAREGGGWIDADAQALGARVGSAAFRLLARDANRHSPELRTHDRFGNRIDTVDFHPAYHELMGLAFGAGLHSLAWTTGAGAFVARAALNYLWNQGENGTACPVTMTFASMQMFGHDAQLKAAWAPKLTARDYDPRPLPLAGKRAVTVGMAMTEKQGGSDLRAVETRAVPIGGTSAETSDLDHALTGHKWFCSAPMSDGFFTLARLNEGVTCFFVPRWLPDGARNGIFIQRLKDKLGNRSNASSEIEYSDALARRIGEPGRGIATLIEMAHLTRFDIVVATAGMMRAGFEEALHHCRHRKAFGKTLAEQPLMKNVLADLAIETEAAMLTAFRLARAFDEGRNGQLSGSSDAQLLARVMTPVAKYWHCKRLPAVAVEAMECLGGNGYVEEGPLARLYREAPLNGIWEGSANVICLDLLRSMERSPRAAELLLEEIALGGPRIRPALNAAKRTLGEREHLESGARRAVEQLAIALQASLMLRHSSAAMADAFCASRLDAHGGRAFGTLPAATAFEAILAGSAPPR